MLFKDKSLRVASSKCENFFFFSTSVSEPTRNLKVWCSTLLRTIQTAAPFGICEVSGTCYLVLRSLITPFYAQHHFLQLSPSFLVLESLG